MVGTGLPFTFFFEAMPVEAIFATPPNMAGLQESIQNGLVDRSDANKAFRQQACSQKLIILLSAVFTEGLGVGLNIVPLNSRIKLAYITRNFQRPEDARHGDVT